MPEQPIVSIIIPTFNRAHLLGETLDSVLAQTYPNWECIVVDDGATDGTAALLANYIDKDSRFQYYKRPDAHLPGGNGARNYGFERSNGEFVLWFDDDDVMRSEKLGLEVKALKDYNVDFVVSKSEFFNHKEVFYDYNYTTNDISFNSFAMGNVSWVTDDIMFKTEIVSTVRFNEALKAGQEYNFCCKVLLVSENGFFLDKFLTLRRFTENSIGENRRKDREVYLTSRFNTYWLNYLDISKLVLNASFNTHSLLICISCYLRKEESLTLPKKFYKALYNTFGIKSIYFLLAKWSKQLFGKYYYFYRRLKGDYNIK